MKRKIIETADGSKTIQIEDWQEQYHSKHGALQEAYHVFIQHGLLQLSNPEINILEIGFGTGLNALVTLIESDKLGVSVHYVGVEKFPVSLLEVDALNYGSSSWAKGYEKPFDKIHSCPWEQQVRISDSFSLKKEKKDFREIKDTDLFNLVYFDAFGARVQPELWTEEIFEIMFLAMKKEGILVTYSAKGSVRRAMQRVGFTVERLEGPPGKREMLRARKI